jgi:hypothetical protein
MPSWFAILEILGMLAVLAGLVAIPTGCALISPALAWIVAGVELCAVGAGLFWLTTPELSARRRRAGQ